MAHPEILALIPARGGSKSIPRKNVMVVAGRPLIAYSIQHGLCAPSITRTLVSTDDPEIAAIAREYGAEVPFLRPRCLAGDFSTDLEVFRHALDWLREHQGYEPELVVHLRPTTPVRSVSLIESAILMMLAVPEADCLRSVSLAEQTPYKMWKLDGRSLRPVVEDPGLPDAHSLPRQALPLAYAQNGYLDIVRPHTVLELGSMSGRHVLPLIMEDKVHDLDYADQIPELERALLAVQPPSLRPLDHGPVEFRWPH